MCFLQIIYEICFSILYLWLNVRRKIMVYDYKKEIKEHIRRYIQEEGFCVDSYARNAIAKILEPLLKREISGRHLSQYMDAHLLEERVAHNWELLYEAASSDDDFSVEDLHGGALWADTLIRKYLLHDCLMEVLDEECDRNEMCREIAAGR